VYRINRIKTVSENYHNNQDDDDDDDNYNEPTNWL